MNTAQKQPRFSHLTDDELFDEILRLSGIDRENANCGFLGHGVGESLDLLEAEQTLRRLEKDRLFAAAPELLEACKLSLHWLIVVHDDCESDALRNPLEQAIAKLEAAISKAEGTTP